ncbi:MAG: glucose-6-phosphate isomerase [Campylobacteraceae bacterium]|nr:glucose-6-phosphate isomerase [Campylobacteraceae bacterium]
MLTNTLHFKTVDRDLIDAYMARLNAEIADGEVGYYHLPTNGSDLILDAESFGKKFKNLKYVVVIGIGGSSLGTKAVMNLLSHSHLENSPSLHFLENLDPWSCHTLLDKLVLENTLFIIVSKSGSTIETLSLAKIVMSQMNCLPGSKKFVEHFCVITDENSPLDSFAKECGLKVFYIPKNVGGRFSVLSAAGLVPLSLCGFDVVSLLEGANACNTHYVEEEHETIMQKAYRYAIHKQASINVLFSYGDAFADFNAWYTQLWAESLGKKHGYSRLGLTPIGLIGSVDQHSFLQLIMEGPKDKTVTFLQVKDWGKSIKIPDLSLSFLEEVNYGNGLDMGTLLNTQCHATMQSVIQEGITTDLIELDVMDAWHVGYLMYYYEILTSTCGLMLGINTYNQPGVEVSKRILKGLLGVKK